MPDVVPETVVVDAFAKLTLSLHITATRPDGYHELDATMVSISEPHDTLTITPADAMSLSVSGPFAADVPADASNLAWRAAEACGATVAIALHKGIPSGAGLGGGSADAAAVLTALGGDPALAAPLGSDVPFCLRGGFAVVRGIGDELLRAEYLPLAIVVVTPAFRCSTAEVYRGWDELGGPHDDVNDLRAAAELVEPRLVEFRAAVEDAGEAPAILAGSGSSYALVFEHESAAERARDRIAAEVEASAWLASTTPVGVEVA